MVLILLSTLAHVAGNALGSQLRTNGSQPLRKVGYDLSDRVPITQPLSPTETDFAPVTRLGCHAALGRVKFVALGAGGLLGAVLGGVLLAATNSGRATIANVALGSLSFAVLGGLLGFWACSFLQVISGAWSEARRDR
jgi:hypothetical protein